MKRSDDRSKVRDGTREVVMMRQGRATSARGREAGRRDVPSPRLPAIEKKNTRQKLPCLEKLHIGWISRGLPLEALSRFTTSAVLVLIPDHKCLQM